MSNLSTNNHYDVIIIGGRCAGATLAMHLARQNLQVLVVDRATFPSLPAVPSSPILHPGTMGLLDEFGLTPEDYTHPGSQINQYILNFVGHFAAVLPTRLMTTDRKFCHGIDRRLLDNALWTQMQRCHPDTVTARDNFGVTDIVRDETGKVVGIVGKTPGGAEETFTADLVVGADGRYSFAARKFGAQVIEEYNDFATAGHQAEWENVEEYSSDLPSSVAMYNTARGFLVLFIPMAERKYIVCTYMRAQDFQTNGIGAEEFYLEKLKSIPQAFNRLKNAKLVSQVVGMRRVENGYRQAFGHGWALVGDALHYKDPLDGQGIYDALIETKILGEVIGGWKRGEIASWEAAGESYDQRVREVLHPMFLSTVGRVQKEMYTFPPKPVINTMIRWMLTDEAYQTKFLNYTARQIPPSELPAMPSAGMIFRGMARGARTWTSKKVAALLMAI